MIRTFVAVDLSEPMRELAREWIDRLGATGAEVKWVEPENLHLTLKFLGDVAESEIAGVCLAVRDAVASRAEFPWGCAGVGAFPDSQRARTLWMAVVDGAAELVDLQQALDRPLAALGYPPERRRFHPHVTLGRVRRASRPQRRELAALLTGDAATGRTASGRVAEVRVYASRLTRSGPFYEVLARTPLS